MVTWEVLMLVMFVSSKCLLQLFSTEDFEQVGIMNDLRLLVVQIDLRKVQIKVMDFLIDFVFQLIGLFLLDLSFL